MTEATEIERLKTIIGLLERDIEKSNEMYKDACDLREMYHAAWLNLQPKDVKSNKSRFHHDGEPADVSGEWFLVQSMLPSALGDGVLISNHYHMDDWDLFHIPEAEKAEYEHDDHETKDVYERMRFYLEELYPKPKPLPPAPIDSLYIERMLHDKMSITFTFAAMPNIVDVLHEKLKVLSMHKYNGNLPLGSRGGTCHWKSGTVWATLMADAKSPKLKIYIHQEKAIRDMTPNEYKEFELDMEIRNRVIEEFMVMAAKQGSYE